MTLSVIIFLLLLFIIGVLLNAFFAGYETGFVSCNPIRVDHLAEKEKEMNARYLQHSLKHPDRMLTVVLIGTNLALVFGTIAITQLTGQFYATLIATPVFLIFSEIVPKSMFRIHPTRLSLSLVPVIRFFNMVLAPVAAPVTWLSRCVVRLSGGSGSGSQSFKMLMRSPEDMRVLVDESASKGAIEEEEKEMIHSVMDLQNRMAREVMVPRINIQALPETASRSEMLALFTESGRTRVPVYRDSIDNIIGIVNAFHLLKDTAPEDESIHRFLQPPLHVHDTMKLDDILRALRDSRQSMAIVTDEYGGTDGLITLEDILEEIFGEIHDEYDNEEAPIRKVRENVFVIETRMPLEDACKAIGIMIDDDEVETVGGWIMHIAGRIPQKGEVIVHDRFRITILAGGEHFLSSIRLETIPREPEGPADESAEKET
jgi:putative hemolysin